jgi:hypothetical protein
VLFGDCDVGKLRFVVVDVIMFFYILESVPCYAISYQLSMTAALRDFCLIQVVVECIGVYWFSFTWCVGNLIH